MFSNLKDEQILTVSLFPRLAITGVSQIAAWMHSDFPKHRVCASLQKGNQELQPTQSSTSGKKIIKKSPSRFQMFSMASVIDGCVT